jgi:hypothetical protein
MPTLTAHAGHLRGANALRGGRSRGLGCGMSEPGLRHGEPMEFAPIVLRPITFEKRD